MFDYTLNGVVKNGDGLSLALYYSDQDLDERSIVKIENGGFTFQGSCDHMQQLNIRFEADIDKLHAYSRKFILTEPGTITIKFDVGRSPANLPFPTYLTFSNYEVTIGPNNLFYRQFFKEYEEASGDRPLWIGPESSQMDYMRKYVYPGARTRILKLYQQYFEQDVSAVYLYLLKSITDQTQGPGYFKGEYLNTKEIDIIKRLFSKINLTLSHPPDYLIMKAAVEELDNIESEINFTEYTLAAIDGAEIQLSKLVQANTLTVLSFWHTICGPCRAFHQEISERYPALKAAGVEFVSLNTDESKSLWKKSSNEDVITWPNLYIGRKSEVLARYRIKGFPAKRVFDQNLKFVELDATNRISWWKDLNKKATT